MLFELKSVGYQVAQKKIIQELTLSLEKEKIHAFIGPNGSGKTTLLRLLSGEIKPTGGEILFDDKPLNFYAVDQLADKRAMLSQQSSLPMSFMVYEVVATGAYRAMKRENVKNEHHYVKPFLLETAVDLLEKRQYNTLSGGEGKRVDFSRMLAQQTQVCFLDEPTNHLDPKHQLKILNLSKSLVNRGKTVIITLHDLNLASMYADYVHVLLEGKLYQSGRPQDVIHAKMVEDVYSIDCEVMIRDNQKPWVLPKVPSFF